MDGANDDISALQKAAVRNDLNRLIDALQNGSPKMQQQAAMLLRNMANEGMDISSAIPILENKLDDKNNQVAMRAAETLFAYYLQKEDWNKIDKLSKHKNSFVRNRIMTYIGDMWEFKRLRDKKAIDILTRGLKDDNPSVRRSAASALGDIHHNSAIAALIDALNDDTEYERESVTLLQNRVRGKVSDMAAKSLIKIGAPTLPLLLQELRDDNNRWRVMEMISQIAEECNKVEELEEIHSCLKETAKDIQKLDRDSSAYQETRKFVVGLFLQISEKRNALTHVDVLLDDSVKSPKIPNPSGGVYRLKQERRLVAVR